MHGSDNMPMEALGSHTGAQVDVTVEQFVPDLSNNAVDGSQQHHSTPPRIKLTGCILFNTSVILGFGIAKAIYSYRGQAIVSTTLDWVSGTALGIVVYWLSVFEAKCPEMWPLFFEDDYAPSILKLIRRPEVRALPFTFLSIVPVVMAAKRMRAVLDIRPYVKGFEFLPSLADGIFVMEVAGLLLAIFSFLQQVRRTMVSHRYDALDNLLRVMGILLIEILVWISDHALKGWPGYPIDLQRRIRSVPFGSTIEFFGRQYFTFGEDHFGYHFITCAAPFLTQLTVVEPRHRVRYSFATFLLFLFGVGQLWKLGSLYSRFNDSHSLYDIFFMSGTTLFLLYHSLSTCPPWRLSIASVQEALKTARDGVQITWGRAWESVSRAVQRGWDYFPRI